MQVFCDMDGVLADFDSHHNAVFGVRSSKLLDNVNWKRVAEHKDFYLNIPPMRDMQKLVDYLWARFGQFTLLTGVPSSVGEASENKFAWARRHLPTVPVITCPSKEKYKFCMPGDLLIDDWTKYKHLWLGAGGVWVTHTSAKATITKLEKLCL